MGAWATGGRDVNELSEGLSWIADPSHWGGPDGIWTRLGQHLQVSIAALAVAALIAIPVGLVVGHTRRGQVLAAQVANVGRAIPSLAILSIAFLIVVNLLPGSDLAFGPLPTFIALTLLAIPPILVNTDVGIAQVDADAVEAARGMGMTGGQVLRKLELPVATPLRGDVELLRESELWSRLGMVSDNAAMERLYTSAMLAEMLHVPSTTR